MKKILFFIFFFVTISYSQTKYLVKSDSLLVNKSLELAISENGTKEKTGKNDGYKVEQYLKSVNLRRGNPYCAAFQYYVFMKINDSLSLNKSIPIAKTGLANGIYNVAKKNGSKGVYEAKINDLIVWKYPDSYSGHIERIIKVKRGGWVTTIAGNTSNGKTGSQREGNGVFIRERNIYHPIGRMRIRGLIGFNYE